MCLVFVSPPFARFFSSRNLNYYNYKKDSRVCEGQREKVCYPRKLSGNFRVLCSNLCVFPLALSLSISLLGREFEEHIRAGTFEEGEKVDARKRRGPMSLPGNIIIGRYFRFYEEEQKQLPQSRCRQNERLIVASESDKDDEGRRNREGVSRGYTPLSAREAASTDISGKSKQERNNITG